MKTSDLEKQLKKLRNITPDASWKQDNGRVLYNQISNSHIEGEGRKSLAETIREAFFGLKTSLSKPAWAVAIISSLVITGGLGAQATQYSKPGDTFYFTKKMTEKLKLALTFDEQEKARMSIRFSSGHARDITETLSDPSFDQASAVQLQDSFREELMSVRRELDTMAMADKEEDREESENKDEKEAEEKDRNGEGAEEGNEQANSEQNSQARATGEQRSEDHPEENASGEADGSDKAGEENANDNNEGDNENGLTAGEENKEDNNENTGGDEQLAEENSDSATTADENSMFVMDFGKQEQGQDIYIPESADKSEEGEGEEVHQKVEEAGRKLENNKEDMDNGSLPELYTLLDRAVENFDQENYEQARIWLERFTQKFNELQEEPEDAGETGEGEVKGVSEDATTSAENKEKEEEKEENSTSTEE